MANSKEIIFASSNTHKIFEVQKMLGEEYLVRSSKDVGIIEDIVEDGDTLERNASIKSHYIYERLGCDCFADDTGLEVYALDNAPGVYSARYAGEPADFENNTKLLLKNMEGVVNRKARFRTVISLIQNGKEHLFEGVVEGEIVEHKLGDGGFGYDPVFVPEGYELTFAQMDIEQKNSISHRGRAVAKLVEFLKS